MKRYRGPEDPLWYKDAIIYQVHVRAFHDSSGDGMGDFRGLASKLDYLKDLGINTIWILPFYPSPLKDDGYDIADYTDIHPMFGTLADFQAFLREAHERGLRVITEVVLNHTSDRHAWFQRARRAPRGSRQRNFYVWSDSPTKYKDARIVFRDFETSNWTWDPVANAYYWHRFYAHQPDLNFDSPHVRKEMLQVVDFWLDMGVDGLRLDAIPYLFEREGTSCENLPETHEFLRGLRKHVDAKYGNRMLLAEANQWPEDAAAYLGKGDECHMAFHFPVMPRMFMAVHMEDRYPIVDILGQTPAIPPSCQWALFLRNHDELTLEMVTDEERDYMYRVYANDRQARINLGIRRRLAPLLQNNRRKLELLNALLFSLPGTPIIYYGDEIGMGDNIYLGDRNGVRTPMQWSSDRNAGFSRANPQRLYLPVNLDPEYHYEAVNVETQRQNPHSLYWWMKRLIALSRKFKAFGRGTVEFLAPENRKILAYLRRHEEETLLVVANMSRFVQYAELDLAALKGRVPVELFGRTEFPPIQESSYRVMLGPHAFLWFVLEPAKTSNTVATPAAAPSTLEVVGDWGLVFQGKARAAVEDVLGRTIRERRWFAGKAFRIKSLKFLDVVPLDRPGVEAAFTIVQVDFLDHSPQYYSQVVAFSSGEKAARLAKESPQSVICGLRVSGKGEAVEGILHDAVVDADVCAVLLDAVARRRRFNGEVGHVVAVPTASFRALRRKDGTALAASVFKGEQSHTCIAYGDRMILKLLRKVEGGINPDLEIGRFLTEEAKFTNVPAVAGHLEYRRDESDPVTIGILNAFVPNQGDAWTFTLDELERYFDRVRARPETIAPAVIPRTTLLELAEASPPAGDILELFGPYLEMARLLGIRTVELHKALASGVDADFAPEPFTPFFQRSIYQSMRNQFAQVIPLLRRRLKDLPEKARPDAERVLAAEGAIRRALERIYQTKIGSTRIRIHGDFHLGQVLYTGKDFVILDFEGEPSRSLSERRLKRSPFRDIAGMVRSFNYAAFSALAREEEREDIRPDQMRTLESAAVLWHRWVSSAYLKAYITAAGDAGFMPRTREERETLVSAYLVDKALYELGYELNNRPAWVRIPLQGLLDLVGSGDGKV